MAEISEKRKSVLEKQRKRSARHRDNETPEKKARRLEKERIRVARSRDNETPEKKRHRLDKDTIRRKLKSAKKQEVKLKYLRNRLGSRLEILALYA